MKFDHYGVPTTKDYEDAKFHPVLRLDYSSTISPLVRIEHMKFANDCIFSEEIQKSCHIAFCVDSIDETISSLDCTVLTQKIDVWPTLTIAYIKIEDVLVELLERR